MIWAELGVKLGGALTAITWKGGGATLRLNGRSPQQAERRLAGDPDARAPVPFRSAQ